MSKRGKVGAWGVDVRNVRGHFTAIALSPAAPSTAPEARLDVLRPRVLKGLWKPAVDFTAHEGGTGSRPGESLWTVDIRKGNRWS